MDSGTIRKKKKLAQGEFGGYFPAKRVENFRDMGFWEKEEGAEAV